MNASVVFYTEFKFNSNVISSYLAISKDKIAIELCLVLQEREALL